MLGRSRAIAHRYGLTAAKMDRALAVFTKVLSQYGATASIPATVSALSANPEIGQKYQAQGLELAIHGWQHCDYSQLSYADQLAHMRKSLDLFRKMGLRAAGFRAPYLRWNADTLTALRESGFTYDSSQALAWEVMGGIETPAYRRVLDFYRAEPAGERLALPALSEGLVRIPYCLPDDEALVERLRLADEAAMADIWLAMLERIYQNGELFTLGLHPERAPLCSGALAAVLKKARSLTPGVWIARLDEIAAWYLALGQTTFEIRQEGDALYHVGITAPERATVLARSLNVRAESQPWSQGYQTVAETAFSLQSGKRPLIGLSPDSPAFLEYFLRHQGYLVEKGADPEAYAYYLDRVTFTQQDERPLVAALEQGDFPLVRLSRWPDGARCALAVTGDIDAITLWDYGRRIFA